MTRELTESGIGSWRVTELLGAGKSALVLRGECNGVAGAVKVFDRDLVNRIGESAQLERIARETALKGKHHPNLVRIYDGGKCDRTKALYVVMELIDAPNLASQIQLIPRERLWSTISQVANAARFLESLGLVHRDIKPENIVITADHAHVVLLDLGVLRPVGTDGSTGDAFVGTHQYGPPEFLLREEEDTAEGWRAVTFYQLGAVLHDLIMRRPMFGDQLVPQARLIEAVRNQSPRIDATDVPPDLALLARNCLLKDPSARLKLVTWESFEPRSPAESPLVSLKDRLRQRRVRAAAREKPVPEPETARAKAARAALDEVANQTESMLRAVCIDQDFFPPVAIRRRSSSPPCARIVVEMPVSAEYSLPQAVDVWFTIELVALETVPTVQISALGHGRPGPTTASDEMISSQAGVSVFRGAFNAELIATALQTAMYSVLDSAQSFDGDAEIGRWISPVAPTE